MVGAEGEGPRLVQREWLSARKGNLVVANLQFYVLDACKTRLVYPIDPVWFMPNMEAVRLLDTLVEDGIGITVSSRKSANIISKTRHGFAF